MSTYLPGGLLACTVMAPFAFAQVPEVKFDPASVANGSALAQSLAFEPDLFRGSFVYKVPIVLPPGREGSGPDLALTYDSSRKNGDVGVGWGLDIPLIRRDTSGAVPVMVTGSLKSYDTAKKFVYECGTEVRKLVLTEINGSFETYRAEGDTEFRKFIHNTASQLWTITERNGTVHMYGSSSAQRINAPGFSSQNGGNIYAWLLQQTTDSDGNRTQYAYAADTNSVRKHVTQIDYGSNPAGGSMSYSVVFSYLPTRPDNVMTFRPGFEHTTTVLLDTIQVKKFNTSLQIRKYDLDYVTNDSMSPRSKLSVIKQEGTTSSPRLPDITLAYSAPAGAFATEVPWGPLDLQGQTDVQWRAVVARETDTHEDYIWTVADQRDFNGDGLIDRVMIDVGATGSQGRYIVQYNTGTGFATQAGGSIPLRVTYPFSAQSTERMWKSLNLYDLIGGATGTQLSILVDFDGNGFPDRVECPRIAGANGGVYTGYFLANLFDGIAFDSLVQNPPTLPLRLGTYNCSVGPTGTETAYSQGYVAPIGALKARAHMIDIDGDGKADRVRSMANLPFDSLIVQKNTGQLDETGAFGPDKVWPGIAWDHAEPLDFDSDAAGWRDVRLTTSNVEVDLVDVNGDGLVDRLMRQHVGSPITKLRVQYNNGTGFEPLRDFGPIPATTVVSLGSIVGPLYLGTARTLIDFDGDGLLDRVGFATTSGRRAISVQFNTGTGFHPTVVEFDMNSQNQAWNSDWSDPVYTSFSSGGPADTLVDLFDITGDGQADRVMRKVSTTGTAEWIVEPQDYQPADLLRRIDNGIGGTLHVTYTPSTSWDNHMDSWTTNEDRFLGNPGQLPIIVHTVSRVVVVDGMTSPATYQYAYEGGFYERALREFRGFFHATATDPLGTRTETWFHQGGGRDGDQIGEFEDDKVAKVGLPFRVTVSGDVGGFYEQFRETIHKVVVEPDISGNWEWPVVSTTLETTTETQGGSKSRARGWAYDGINGRVSNETDFGLVNPTAIAGEFTDPTTPADKILRSFAYADILDDNDVDGRSKILDRVFRILTTQDGTTLVRETLMTYTPISGNLETRREWFSETSGYVEESFTYYGNGLLSTYRDRAGVLTTVSYDDGAGGFFKNPDSITRGALTSTYTYDSRGFLLTSTNEKGLVTKFEYDEFYRPKQVLVSSTPFGTPDTWKERFSYSPGGFTNQESANVVGHDVNDGVDADGFESRTTVDGLGRPVQVRSEYEQSGVRAEFIFYDKRGHVAYRTNPRVIVGASLDQAWIVPPDPEIVPGMEFGYDPLGRTNRSEPTPNGGDQPRSPTGAEVREYLTWGERVTDAENKVKQYTFDAFGRLTDVLEGSGSAGSATRYTYDFLGNLTQMCVDTQGQNICASFTWTSLGTQKQMTHPDLGTWSYAFDNAGRVQTRTDANGNILTYTYDGQDRIEHIDNNRDPAHNVTFTYDSNQGVTGYTVAPGQLFEVADGAGWERFSWDHRDRKTKSTRYLGVNGKSYTTQWTHDMLDRPKTLTYPGSVSSLSLGYDSAMHLNSIVSTSGTMGAVTFFGGVTYTEDHKLKTYTHGNGVATTLSYFVNSRRMSSIFTQTDDTTPVVIQQLAYDYHPAGSIKKVNDQLTARHPAGQSSTIDSIVYDDFKRISSYVRNAVNVGFTYTKGGNVLTSGETGPGTYTYNAVKKHAVTQAGGSTFTYDAGGNVKTRVNASGTVLFDYDELNRLDEFTAPGPVLTTFGYAHDGARLWKKTGTVLHVWIGDHYEERGNVKICNVIADGLRLASYIPVVPPGVVPTLKVVYFHLDRLGSVNVGTKQVNTEIAHYEYKTFGASFFTDEGSLIIDPYYKFLGEPLDGATGLYYLDGRYYEPAIGRFLQPGEPIVDLRDPQTLNPYSLLRNDPLN